MSYGFLKFKSLLVGGIEVVPDDVARFQQLWNTKFTDTLTDEFKKYWVVIMKESSASMFCGSDALWNKSEDFPRGIPEMILIFKQKSYCTEFSDIMFSDKIVKIFEDADIKTVVQSWIQDIKCSTYAPVKPMGGAGGPISPIAISGGGLCVADGRKATAYLRGPDGTLTALYDKVTVISSVPNPISGPVNISGFRRVVGGRSDHPHPSAYAHLVESGQVSLGELIRRGVFDR
jgi:hypothetical protein